MKQRILLTSLLPMAACISAAYAQEAAPAAQAEPTTVVVTGFRSSLERSLNLKQAAVGVRDSIVAEDIGKFPEANVAESLQRIPGVYLSRDPASGEGQRVNIRGLGPEYSVTTFNGMPVHTTSSGNVGSAVRDFNYDVFASDLFGRVDFYKTPLAELPEGGIGGVVDMQPLRPFDRKGRTIRYAASAVYNDASRKTDPRYSLVLSNTWGSFGALVGYAGSSSTNLRSGFQSTGSYNSNFYASRNQGPFNYSLDYGDPRANLGNLSREQVDQAFLPRFHRAYGSVNERERDGLVTSLQYKTGQWDVSLDGLYSKLKDVRDEHTFGLAIRNSRTTNRAIEPGRPGHNGLVPIDVFIDANNNLQGTFGNTSYINENYFYDSETEFGNASLNAKYIVNDSLRFSAQFGGSRSEAALNANRIFTNLYGVTSTIDSSANRMYPQLTANVDFNNPALFKDPTLGYAWAWEKDSARSLKLVADYNYELPWGVTGHLKAGYVRDEVKKQIQKRNGTAIGATQQLSIGTTLAALGNGATRYMVTGSPFDDFARGAPSTFPTSWAHFDRGFMNVLDPNRANAAAPLDTAQSFQTTEDVDALFIQSDFTGQLFERELRVNVGARYTRTRTHIDNFTQARGADGKLTYVPATRDGGYNNLLPMMSAAYEITPDVIVRASAGRTLTRAALNIIAANTVIPEAARTVATSGNPNLKPQIADQVDLTAEWYFRKGSLLSLGLFHKKLKDTTVAQVQTVPFSSLGLPDNALAPNLYDPATGRPDPNLPITLSTYYNEGEQKIRGVELAYQQAFNFLPAPFDGLGAIASYTRVNAPIAPWGAPDGTTYKIWQIPRYSYSATVYYEKGPWALRSSYNYKDRRINDVRPSVHGLQNWTEGRGYLDASISYKLSDKLEIRLDGLNLNNDTNEFFYPDPAGRYGDGHSRTENLIRDGRVIMVGLRGRY